MISKLLILGVDTSTQSILNYTKKNDIYTIITDYREPQDSPLKLVADDYWMINITDLDQLEAKCRETGVTAVMAGNHEMCLDSAKELCHRLGFPFYASDYAWRTARNKLLFKETCLEVGLEIPRTYHVNDSLDEIDLTQIKYPVMVKPSDQMAGRGISQCFNEEELRIACQKARDYSTNGRIVVEEYVNGDELSIGCYVDQGVSHIVAVTDAIKREISGRKSIMLYSCRSRYFDECIEVIGEKIHKFIKALAIQNGCLFFQCIRKDGHYYFLEFGYRISGAGLWMLTEKVYGFNYVEWMVDLALGQKPSINWDLAGQCFENKHCMVYLYWVKPGKVGAIRKIDAQNLPENVSITIERFKPGDEIAQTSDFYQVGWYIQVIAESAKEIADKIRFINDNLQLLDEDGNNMMIPFDDYDYLLKYC